MEGHEYDPYNNPDFNHGMDIGISIGHSEAAMEAQAAADAGEIDLWLEFNRPKTIDGWREWEKVHGPSKDFHERWKK